MLRGLLEVLDGRHTPEINNSEDELKVAVAALLVEAGRMDQDFKESERKTIAALLADRFEMTAEETEALIRKADKKVDNTEQYFPFTRDINSQMSSEERIHVIEMLWSVAYADGQLDPYEDALIRQIAGLIHVTDRDRMQARKRALAKHDIA